MLDGLRMVFCGVLPTRARSDQVVTCVACWAKCGNLLGGAELKIARAEALPAMR